MVFEHEKTDDLGIGGYKVIQDKRGFCFGSDAVLLSAFVSVKKGDIMLDLCTGTGIIPILVWAKNDLEHIDAIEIIPQVADMAKRTMLLNNLADKITVTEGDLKNAVEIYGSSKYDVITCNPPYMHVGGGIINPNDLLAVSRHEILCTLDDIVRVSSKLLKCHGKIFMVYRTDRLCDLITTFRKYKIEPKKMTFIHPKEGKAPNLVLVEGLHNGKAQLKITPPIYMYDNDGNYTHSLEKIYGGGKL